MEQIFTTIENIKQRSKLRSAKLYFVSFGLFFLLAISLLLSTYVVKQQQTIKQHAQTPPNYTVTGLSAEYFNNKTLANSPIVTRQDSQINYNWGNGSPAQSINKDGFSARWKGNVVSNTTEEYTFYFKSDDGGRVYINGQLLINAWQSQSGKELTGKVQLTAGVETPIVVEYYEDGGDSYVYLSWSSGSIAKQIVRAPNLVHTSTTPPQTADFISNYKGWSSSAKACTTSYNILGKEPTQEGTYPVFIYITGTDGFYDGETSQAFIKAAAKKGFVAGSVAYQNDTSEVNGKIQCIYDGSSIQSAVSVLCSRAKADCSKGVVTSGHSQGALIAFLANNYEPRIQAAYILGYKDTPLEAFGEPATRKLPNDRLRIVDGGHAWPFDSSYSDIRKRLETVTELSCGSNAFSCFRQNGSGWYIIQDTEMQDKSADHNYFVYGENADKLSPLLDSGWVSPATHPWSLDTNIEWLKSFTGTSTSPTSNPPSATPTETTTATPTPTPTGAPTPTPTKAPTPTPTKAPTPTPTKAPTPTPTPSSTSNGLTGVYYNNKDFTGTTVTRIDPTINFDWGWGAPHSSIASDTFSVRWTGKVHVATSGTWTFSTTSDDGVRLWVNNQLLVNNWTNHGATTNSGSISLNANQKYDIKLEYYEDGGSAIIKLLMKGPGASSNTVIPSSNLWTQ